ncbi:MAG: YMGG-like glycine zipper-containing protein [bacterium]
MHRSRLSVLVIFAAVAACSTHDDFQETDLLSQDRALVARLEIDSEVRPVPLPAACGAVPLAAQPAIANRTLAKELTLQAQGADMQGNVREAQSLLRRASELDETNKSAAYHLGRTNEALGDRAAAMTAYCRYLALTPTTAESAEARQRVSDLTRAETRTSAGSVSESATPMHRHASATIARRVTSVRPARERRARTSAAPATISPKAEAHDGNAEARDVVATQRPVPMVDESPTESRAERRGPSRTQSTIFGAATGAMIGAATGHSVKGAVIGAAAGGIFGNVVGRGTR